MAKRGFGKFIVLATLVGAVAAGISYFTKYKSFHKELEEDFHDFEDDDDDYEEKDCDTSSANRNYVSLSSDKDEFVAAAEDMASAAKDMADAAKDMVRDTASIVSETASEAASAAADTAHTAVKFTKEKIQDMAAFKDKSEEGHAAPVLSSQTNSVPVNEETTKITEEI